MAKPSPRGQSETLGFVLIFALVIAGTGVIVTFGSAALTDSQEQSNINRAEQELSLFDSRAAMVALGDAERQNIRLSGTEGSYVVDGDSGTMTVQVTNVSSGNTEVVFQETMGKLTYRSGDTKLAYQGGGVWKKGPSGRALMVSPPEFHYRRATLTLPVIRVTNDDAAGGSIDALVEPSATTNRIYPDESQTFTNLEDGTTEYANPIRRSNWTVAIKVQSEYAEGWYMYFKERTAGQATYWESNNTARVILKTISGSPGDFPIPAEGNSQPVQGIAQEGHAVNEFHLDLTADNHYNNMHWSFYVDRGNTEFELHFASDGKCQGGSFSGDIDVSVYYRNETTSPTTQEEWRNTAIDSSDYTVDCSTNPATLHIDLVPSDSQLTYKEIESESPKPPGTSGNKWIFSANINDAISDPSETFDAHSVDSTQYTTGDTEDMSFVISHYMGLLGPTYDMTVTDGPGSSERVDESASTGRLVFEEANSAQFLTFLHITENEITINVG